MSCAVRKPAAPSNSATARADPAWSSLAGRSGSSTTTSSILSSASSTFACRPGSRSPSRSMSMATNGWPSNWSAARLGFVQQDNAFTQLDDPAKAQRLADRFPRLDWVKILDRWARQVNPLLARTLAPRPGLLLGHRPGRVRHRRAVPRPAGLGRPLPALLDHAVLNFSAQDILGFLGRSVHRRFDGEVLTDCKKTAGSVPASSTG